MKGVIGVGVFSKLKRPRLSLSSYRRQLQNASNEPRIFFVSHEATLTGAPKIILNVLKSFSTKTNASFHTILHNGGHLCDDFAELSQTDCLNLARQPSDDLTRKIRKIINRQKSNLPVVAICNSMESRHIAIELKKHGIPVIFLVHELPSSYCEEDYKCVYSCADRVIFPVQTVRDAAHKLVNIPDHKSLVLPQGLLQSNFGQTINRQQARDQIRQELGIPTNSLVVLGCGTLDLRKGIDHFASVARIMASKKQIDRPVHFVWVGDGAQWVHSTHHYVMLDVNKSAARGHVHFVGERQDVEPFFVGSDTFLLTSRVDPFPCVIHEAMAAGLPVVAFENSGGATEAINDGAGITVPFGECEEMADMILMLAKQPSIAESVRQRSMEKVHADYQFDLYADRLIQLAEEVCGLRLRSQTYSSEAAYPLRSAA